MVSGHNPMLRFGMSLDEARTLSFQPAVALPMRRPSGGQLRAGRQDGAETADDAEQAVESLDGGDHVGRGGMGCASARVLRRRLHDALQSKVERNLDRMGEIFRKPHVWRPFGLDLLGLLPGG